MKKLILVKIVISDLIKDKEVELGFLIGVSRGLTGERILFDWHGFQQDVFGDSL